MRTYAVHIEEVIAPVVLPDGQYEGLWSGYEVKVTVDNRDYRIQTKAGAKGIDEPCIVTSTNGYISIQML